MEASRTALRLPPDSDSDVDESAAVAQDLSLLSLKSPASRVISPGVVLTDITDRFVAAASTLQPGELVKDGYFTLFEAVSALEIMDPKMDSGVDLADDDAYDVGADLSLAQVVGIIDQLLCLEMAWHLGYPLSQTLLTSLYVTGILLPTPRSLDEADYARTRPPGTPRTPRTPRTPAHAVLHAYCVTLVATCGAVKRSIRNEVYYEEEDMATNTHSLALLEDVAHDEFRQLLKSARQSLDETPESKALRARLDVRDAFLTGLELAELRVQPESLRVPWTMLASAVAATRDSHDVGEPVPRAFNTRMQVQLASTMPPRPMVQPSFDEAMEHWSRLAADAADAVAVLDYRSPEALLTFCHTLMGARPQPLVFVRTLVQGLVYGDNVVLGRHSIRRFVDDDLALVAMPASVALDPVNDAVEAVHDPRFAVARLMEAFRATAFPPLLELVRTLCQNRCRARRMLCHLLLDWDACQHDAQDLDVQLHAAIDDVAGAGTATGALYPDQNGALALPLSSWVFLYKLRTMEWIVQLGFELQVYLPDELAGMYWYLATLARRRAHHAERIRSFVLASLDDLRERRDRHDRPLDAPHADAFRAALVFLRTTILDASVTADLADGLAALYAALLRTRCLADPDRPYSSDALRYQLRMKPFAVVAVPELPSFDTFRAESRQTGSTVDHVLASAEHALVGAKKGLEAMARFTEDEALAANCHARWLTGVKSTLKSAIVANLAVATLKKELKDGDTPTLSVDVPGPDQCYHPWWVVPKLVPAKKAENAK